MTEAEWLACTDPLRMLEWLTADPTGLNLGARRLCYPSDRKLRLFACACCRQVWDRLTDDVQCPECDGGGFAWPECRDECGRCAGTGRVNRSRRAVEVAELYADGLATGEEADESRLIVLPHPEGWLTRRCGAPDIAGAAMELADGLTRYEWLSSAAQAALLREIFGNPLRPAPHVHGRYGDIDCPECEGAGCFAGGYFSDDGTEPCDYCGGRGTVKGDVPDASWLTPTVVSLAQAAYDARDFGHLPILADALAEAGCTDNAILDHFHHPGPHVRGCWAIDLLLGKE